MSDRDDELTRLFVRDIDEIPLPARERWHPAPRKESFLMSIGRTMSFGAAAVAVIVLALVASFALREQPPIAARPSPSESVTPTPSSLPTQTSAAASVAPSASATGLARPTNDPSLSGRYVSILGYSIETPSPWHLTTCSERVQGMPDPMGEVFVPVPARDETGTDMGTPYTTLFVASELNPQNLTPRQWAEQGKTVGGEAGAQIEDVTYAGRPAARKSMPLSAPGLYSYFVANAGRMYVVSPQIRAQLESSPRTSLVRMIDSFQFITDAQRAAARAALPPAPAPRTPEQLADALASAFAAKDTKALAALAAPCIFRFGEQAGGTTWSREKYLEDLQAMFAAGLTVTVQARPITDGDTQVSIASTWKDSRGTQTRRIVLARGPTNDHWQWAGTIERYQ